MDLLPLQPVAYTLTLILSYKPGTGHRSDCLNNYENGRIPLLSKYFTKKKMVL